MLAQNYGGIIVFEKIKERKNWKNQIKQEVKKDKQDKKAKMKEINNLPKEIRKVKKTELRKQRKQDKKQMKADLKELDRKERKRKKKHNKMYKKIKNRPRRYGIWGGILLLILIPFINYFPYISNAFVVLSGRDVTAVTDSPEGIAAREQGEELSKEISDEGIVLIRNEEDHLPLEDKKVNVFGVSAFNFRYGGGGSGGVDSSRALSLFEGFEESGVSVNKELHAFYEEFMASEEEDSEESQSGLMDVLAGMFGGEAPDEPEIDYLTDDAIEQAKGFSDNALIVIGADGVEASDLSAEQLKLTQNKRDLIEKVTGEFEDVTIVVNAGNALDLGFVDKYPSIKSVLWVGTPGTHGTKSLGEILAGTLNPSGRLVDTYAHDIDSSPASVNFGDYKYENTDKAFINYQEGIYVGYRYYETYYENDEEGYEAAVQFPFGYGLSYTDFEWEVVSSQFTEETIELEVEVENTGDYAGKDVVQLYYSAPYTEGGIEKSAIELAAFAKTVTLEPGESETLMLSYDTEDMASYDMDQEQAYVLEAGTYSIKLAQNVHDIVDTLDYELEETIVYEEDSDTGTPYQNQFDNAHGEIDYLSRNDWDGTFPSDENLDLNAPDYVLEALAKEIEASDSPEPEFGIDNGLQLEDMKGVAYDDPKWDDFMEQFTYKELRKIVTHAAYKTLPVDRLGVPQTLLMDGPAGFNYFFGEFEAAAYPAEAVVASTWNQELAYSMGESSGKEARAYGIHGWYAPALNIHRTPQGGRNFEYFSEDPLLNGKMGAAITKGAQDQGIIVFLKHFALNEQETNARSGIMVWSNEQAIRELHLKPFEIAVKEGGANGMMSSFSYIGPEWAGENDALLRSVLRDEWGFEGVVSSDAVFGFMEAPKAITSGNDLMLDVMTPASNVARIDEAYEKNPEVITEGLRTSVKNVSYSILKTYLFE